MAARTRLEVGAADAGARLDQFLAAHLEGVSRSQIQRLIRDGHVSVSAGDAKASLAVTADLVVEVEVPPPMPATPGAEDLPLSLIHISEPTRPY